MFAKLWNVMKKIIFAIGVFYTVMLIIGFIALACGYQPPAQ